MNNYEILKQHYNEIIKSKEFDNTVSSVSKNRVYYYNILKDYFLKDWKPNGVFTSKNGYFNYIIDYCFRCMVMDGKISGYSNTSVVYFIRNEYTGLLKIGKTNNLKRRIKEIENAFNFLGFDTQKLTIEAISYCLFGLNNSKVETYYHNQYQDYRVKGEWFDISNDFLYENVILCADYMVEGIPIIVEDRYDYEQNFKKIKLIESDADLLYDVIKNEISNNLRESLGIIDDSIFTKIISTKKKSHELFSYEIWNYIANIKNKEEFNLDNKIIHNIENMLI